MTVIYQKWIERSDLEDNPNVLYLFGDNTKRVGMGGQAGAMRGEDNAVGVATKWAPGMRDSDFYSDDDFDKICQIIDADMEIAFTHARNGGIIVVPSDGLGTGLSDMPYRAPKAYAYLEKKLKKLAVEG